MFCVFICLPFRPNGQELGQRLKSIGEFLTYHGMVLNSEINDGIPVMDEGSGKLVSEYNTLGGGTRDYKHIQ